MIRFSSGAKVQRFSLACITVKKIYFRFECVLVFFGVFLRILITLSTLVDCSLFAVNHVNVSSQVKQYSIVLRTEVSVFFDKDRDMKIKKREYLVQDFLETGENTN